METPQALQLPELKKYNQFRVELPNPDILYDILSKKNCKKELQIGETHSEDELFSQINAKACIASAGVFSIIVEFKYQNSDSQYWPKEQKQKILKQLKQKGYAVSTLVKNNYSSLTLDDKKSGLNYVIGLGYENEKDAWKSQVAQVQQKLVNNTDLPTEEISRLRSTLSYLKDGLQPYHTTSSIEIHGFDISTSPPNPITEVLEAIGYSEELVIERFRKQINKSAVFIESFVHSMSNAKEEPQSGKLILQ